MVKKILLASSVLLAVLTLSACKPKEFTVTFNSQDGSAVADVVVVDGELVAAPTDPTKADTAEGKVNSFVGWYTEAAGTTAYDFTTPVTADLTLYAKWSLEVVLNFDTKTDEVIDAQMLGEDGGNATKPADPTMDGYRFGGWFTTKRGLYWLEDAPITFPLEVTTPTTIYAYWEPLDSKAVNYSREETYISSMNDTVNPVMNPMTYQYGMESDFIDRMVTALYTTEVDWDKAIADGVADSVNDFSKLINQEFAAEALDYRIIKLGATQFPLDSDGEEHLTEDGLYDRDNASSIMRDEWTINFRDDLYFEDGTNITAEDYAYTVMQFLNPLLNNERASSFYQYIGEDGKKQGYAPIENAYEFYKGDINPDTGEAYTFDEVGFTINNDYSFTLNFWTPISQSAARGLANSMRLIHKDTFEASLTEDKTNSSYGTPSYPYVSYGSYILKTWDENQKLVWNKNFDYIAKDNFNYKSMVNEVVSQLETRFQMFDAGDLDVIGLTLDYFNKYSERDNLYFTWGGYPEAVFVNVAPSSDTSETGNEHPTIMFDTDFRQALFFGFNRSEYANTVNQPDAPSVLGMPIDTKLYVQDAYFYYETPQHKAVAAEFGITDDNHGYIPSKAQDLFTAAYDRWIAEGNTGPVVLNMIADNDEDYKRKYEYVETSYEKLFNTEGLTDKIDIQVTYEEINKVKERAGTWDYDLYLTGVGFGSSTGAYWQLPSLAFFGGTLAKHLGLYQPFDESTETGIADYWYSQVEVDLTNTWNYLEDYTVAAMEDEDKTDWVSLYDNLKAWPERLYTQEDVDNGMRDADGDIVVVGETMPAKAAGIYRVTLRDAAYLVWYDALPWDATAEKPYAGADTDLWNLLAAYERVYIEYGIQVPTTSSRYATLYSDRVTRTWPVYSVTFEWGPARYSWLNSDPDFADFE